MRWLLLPLFASLIPIAGCGPRPSPPPWTGEQRALVVLLSWSDREPEVTRAQVEAAFFDPEGDSLRTWFAENSAGAMEWSGEVLEWRELDDAGQQRYLNADNAVGAVLSRSVEARADIVTFVQGVADAGLARNFTQIERDTEMNWEEQYLQVRASLREVI